MVATDSLSEQDLAALRAELAAGKVVTVWFTPAAVGVPTNGSAKMISVDEPAEGDFIQVKPGGSRDTMFCSPNELTRTRPPRKRAQRPAGTSGEAPGAKPGGEPVVELVVEAVAPVDDSPDYEPLPPERPARRRPVRERPPAPATGVVLTLTATPEGEWTVEVVVGKKRTVRPTPVQPAEVAKAARALPAEVAEAIESSLDAARSRQLERVERLSAELEAAQRALRELSG